MIRARGLDIIARDSVALDFIQRTLVQRITFEVTLSSKPGSAQYLAGAIYLCPKLSLC